MNGTKSANNEVKYIAIEARRGCWKGGEILENVERVLIT